MGMEAYSSGNVIQATEQGLYCRAGDFYIDPSEPVERAVVTHAHSDHARPGCEVYLAAEAGLRVLRERLGEDARIQGIPYGEVIRMGAVEVSLHPAGHILGSAQVRVSHRGEVWVISGDYKREQDVTCQAFEPLRCHVFVTEATYALPIYRWPPQEEVFGEIHAWWRRNQEAGRTSILFAYALGKAQRVLARLDPEVGPIAVHEAVRRYLGAYEAAGVKFPPLSERSRGRGIVIAPPWAKGEVGAGSKAMVSGWMQVRGMRRRESVDRGFVLSDHADWEALAATVRETGAEKILVLHGYAAALARWLREQGWNASPVSM
jgi:putative mRNA 3-end processing factor